MSISEKWMVKVLCTKKIPTLEFTLEISNGQKESFKEKFGKPLIFTKFCQFIKKKKQTNFQRDILDTCCLCEICKNATLIST